MLYKKIDYNYWYNVIMINVISNYNICRQEIQWILYVSYQ